ncbi:MAG: hypothetical protein P8N50_06320 [Actinomycetota bacterium]|jgi:hypothetical protein|nr:hypothetical protein [Actinomycetota bacterium]
MHRDLLDPDLALGTEHDGPDLTTVTAWDDVAVGPFYVHFDALNAPRRHRLRCRVDEDDSDANVGHPMLHSVTSSTFTAVDAVG